MMIDDFTIRYEVLNEDQAWVPFTAEALGLAEDDDGLDQGMVRDREMIEVWQDPLDFARQELDNAAEAIAWHPRLDRLAGLRILLWPGQSAEGEPDLTLRVTPEQLAIARLNLAARGVHAAVQGLREARDRLRAQILSAELDDHLGRNQIARTVEYTLSRRLVLQYLGGHDLIRDARKVLPHDWARRDGYEYALMDEPPEGRAGPFWCGPVLLNLSPTGQVELSIIDIHDGPGFDADDEEITTYEREARQRALVAAEEVHAALDGAGIRMLRDDKDVGVQELASGPVTLARRAAGHRRR